MSRLLSVQGLWQLDQDFFRFLHVKLHRDSLDFWILLITNSGLGQVQLALLLPFVIWKKTRRLGFLMILSGILAGMIRLVLTYGLLPRQRPSNFEFARPLESVFGWTSFPSGHASTSFAIALALGLALTSSRQGWLFVLIFLWACMVGLSRVYTGVHFPSDIVAGFGVGMVSAGLSYLLFEKIFPSHQSGEICSGNP